MTSTQPILVQPNVFQLQGYNTQISYSTTSFTGVPELTYVSRGETLNFRGENIRTEQTQLGQMVTVNLSSNLAAVGGFESLTLLIPAVSLPLNSRESFIQTIAVFSLRGCLKSIKYDSVEIVAKES
jgi:hypothetical protein